MQPSSIADRVRDARQAAGLTQQDLASRAGVALRTLNHIESGKEPRIPTLRAIARVLDVPLTELVGNDDEPDTVAS